MLPSWCQASVHASRLQFAASRNSSLFKSGDADARMLPFVCQTCVHASKLQLSLICLNKAAQIFCLETDGII